MTNNHSPESLRELARAARAARAALAALDDSKPVPNDKRQVDYVEYCRVVSTPALLIALVDRLEHYADELDGSELARGMPEARFRKEAMTAPLRPAAPRS